MQIRSLFLVLLAGFLAVATAACSSGPSNELKQDATETYARIVHASYQDALQKAEALDAELEAFVADPSAERFEAAKEAWLAAREPYGQTEVYRFYAGPIDDADGPEALMNAWPMDEAFIDYVRSRPNAGIINNPEEYPEITPELLMELNEQDSEESISTGFHAIEFLLWGQDFYEDSPGQRSYTDYVQNDDSVRHAERRGQYLLVVGDLLVRHLREVTQAWAPDEPSNYRASFLEANPDEALRRILVGMGSLSGAEMAGERLEVPYQTRNQEDEHSCFSDNTHRDMVTNAIGLRNVYLGQYEGPDGEVVEGTGVYDVVQAQNPELADQLKAQLDSVVAATRDLEAPFDQEIQGGDDDPGRERVLDTIESLQTATRSIAQAADALGIRINVEA
jgi:putative iron-regulated protein